MYRYPSYTYIFLYTLFRYISYSGTTLILKGSRCMGNWYIYNTSQHGCLRNEVVFWRVQEGYRKIEWSWWGEGERTRTSPVYIYRHVYEWEGCSNWGVAHSFATTPKGSAQPLHVHLYSTYIHKIYNYVDVSMYFWHMFYIIPNDFIGLTFNR